MATSPTIANLTVYRGEEALLDFVVNPVESITSWTIIFTISSRKNMVIKQFTVAATIISAPAATYRATIPPASLALIPVGGYWYDCWQTFVGTTPKARILQLGRVKVLGNVRVPTA